MDANITQRRLSRRQVLSLASKGAALAGLSTVASACGGLGSNTAGDRAASGKTTTIQFITPAALGLERTMYENFVLKFMDKNPNIKVKLSFEAWEDYMTKLPTMLAGGVTPDVVHQHMSIVQDYGQRSALLDLNHYMKRDAVKPDDYIPALFDAFSHEGKTYGIPKDSAAWGVYYNKSIFDKAGLDYPKAGWTLQDFRTLVRELTRDRQGRPASDPKFDSKNIKQWGFSWMDPSPTESESARGFVKAFGGDWYNEDYTGTTITDKPVLEDFEMFHTMRCTEHSTPTPAQAEAQGDPFRSGLTAMAVSFHVMDFFCQEEKVKFDYDVTYMPAGPGGQYVPVGCSGWAIPAKAQHQDEAWQLIRYLTSLPVQQSIGEQKRWGVSLKQAVDAIIPEETPAKNFRKVHVDPLSGTGDRKVISFKFPANQSRIKEIYSANFDPIWTCASDDIAAAAQKTRQQVDEALKG